MKKAFLFLTMILFFNSIYCQDRKTNDNDRFSTVGYFSSKNLIAIKCKILKLESYAFLQIVLDDELYVSDYDSLNGISLTFNLNIGKSSPNYVIFTPISNEVKNKRIHLILLDENEIETLKQSKITNIEISLGYSTTYSFKNIQEPNFFINNLK